MEALHTFVERHGWQQTEELPPPWAPPTPYTLNRRSFIITDRETFVTVSVSSAGGLDLRGDDGKLKTKLLEWIRKEQPKAMVLKRELESYLSSTTKPGGKAWEFDRGSWQLVEEGIYICLREEDGPDLEEAIRQAGYESRMPIRLGMPKSSFRVEVYTSQKGDNVPSPRYPYFVGVQMLTDYECIYVTDFPSLISLLIQLGTIVDKVQNASE
jgi:hypothetical protein